MKSVDGNFASEVRHGDVVGGSAVVGRMVGLVLGVAFLDVGDAVARGEGGFGAVAGELGEAGGAGCYCGGGGGCGGGC